MPGPAQTPAYPRGPTAGTQAGSSGERSSIQEPVSIQCKHRPSSRSIIRQVAQARGIGSGLYSVNRIHKQEGCSGQLGDLKEVALRRAEVLGSYA